MNVSVVAQRMKKGRIDLSGLIPRLEEFYARGLVALSTPEQQQLAEELCSETGLSHKQIKVD